MGDAVPQIDLLPQRGPDGITFTFVTERLTRRVAVAGTFNSWRGEVSPLQRIDAGRWQTTLPIMPGRHLYKYVLDGEDWVRDPANPWVSEDGQGNSCFTLTEAGERYIRRGEIGPTRPGPLYRDHAATPSPSWLRDAVIYELSARAVGGLTGARERLPQRRDAGVADALRPRRAALRRLGSRPARFPARDPRRARRRVAYAQHALLDAALHLALGVLDDQSLAHAQRLAVHLVALLISTTAYARG